METHNCCVVVGCGGIYTVYTQYRVQLQDQNSHFCVAGVAWILSRQTKDKESGANICAYTYIHEHDTRKAWEDSSGRWQTCKTVQIFAKNATSRCCFLPSFPPVRPPCISCLGVKVKSPGIEANVPREGCRMVSLKESEMLQITVHTLPCQQLQSRV